MLVGIGHKGLLILISEESIERKTKIVIYSTDNIGPRIRLNDSYVEIKRKVENKRRLQTTLWSETIERKNHVLTIT